MITETRGRAMAMAVAGASLLAATYLALFVLLGYIGRMAGVRFHYWNALIAAAIATWAAIRLVENGQWRIGFFVPPRRALIEGAIGAAAGAILIGLCDALIESTTHIRHLAGSGFPWREIVVIYIPAAVHEEVLFRGYVYQRVRRVSRIAAIVIISAIFAALHAGNSGATPLAIVSVFGGGALLAAAYERYERLWLPIGLHFAWNVTSGAVLGYGVSGYEGAETMLRTVGSGPQILTGGVFGIEASVWALLVEAAGAIVLLRKRPARLL